MSLLKSEKASEPVASVFEPAPSLVDINLVTWQGERYLPALFESLATQTFLDWNLQVLDNGSTDATPDIVERWIATHGGKLVRHTSNQGFARAHNELLRLSRAPYVFVINQDTEFSPDYLAKLYAYLEANTDVGSASGLLYSLQTAGGRLFRSTQIDSAGLACYRTHRVVERMQGRKEKVALTAKVFGVPATLALYRRSALEAISFHGTGQVEYFDESFGSYKEDVDVAYRLQLAGWSSACVAEAVGYHARSVRPGDDIDSPLGNAASLRHRREKNEQQNEQSYGNHLMFLFGSCFFPFATRERWLTLLYECGKFFALLLTEPSTLRAWGRVRRNWTRLQLKRQSLAACGSDWRRVRSIMS